MKAALAIVAGLSSMFAIANVQADFVITPPEGKVALLHDGNSFDRDDIAAFPMAAAIFKYAGLSSRVAHIEHSNNVCKHWDKQYQSMRESAEGIVDILGYSSSIVFDYYSMRDAAHEHLVSLINTSSQDEPLQILAAGPMESAWRALNAAERDQLQYVEVVSHARWNENYKGCEGNHDWQDIKDEFRPFGLTTVDISGQNRKDMNSDFSDWTWLRDSGDPALEWLYSRPETTKFDVSDAGMSVYSISGCQKCGNDELQQFMLSGAPSPEPEIALDESLFVQFLQPEPGETFDLAGGLPQFLVYTKRTQEGDVISLTVNGEAVRTKQVNPDDYGYNFLENLDLPTGAISVQARLLTDDNRYNDTQALDITVFDSRVEQPRPSPTAAPTPVATPLPEATPAPTQIPSPEPTPQPTLGPTPNPTPEPLPDDEDSEPGVLYLIDTETDLRVSVLEDGSVIDASLLSEGQWSLEYVPAVTDVDAVAFYLDDNYRRIERVAPYALYGDKNSNFRGQDADTGDRALRVEIRQTEDRRINIEYLLRFE